MSLSSSTSAKIEREFSEDSARGRVGLSARYGKAGKTPGARLVRDLHKVLAPFPDEKTTAQARRGAIHLELEQMIMQRNVKKLREIVGFLEAQDLDALNPQKLRFETILTICLLRPSFLRKELGEYPKFRAAFDRGPHDPPGEQEMIAIMAETHPAAPRLVYRTATRWLRECGIPPKKERKSDK